MPERIETAEGLGFIGLTLRTGGDVYVVVSGIWAVEKDPNEEFTLVRTVSDSLAVVETPKRVFALIQEILDAQEAKMTGGPLHAAMAESEVRVRSAQEGVDLMQAWHDEIDRSATTLGFNDWLAQRDNEQFESSVDLEFGTDLGDDMEAARLRAYGFGEGEARD